MKHLQAHLLGSVFAALLWMAIPFIQTVLAGESLAADAGFVAAIFAFIAVTLFIIGLPFVALGYPLVKRLGYVSLGEWVACGFIGGTVVAYALAPLVVDTAPEWNAYMEMTGWPRAMLFVEHFMRGAVTGMAFAASYWWIVESSGVAAKKPAAKAAPKPAVKVAAKPVAKATAKAKAKAKPAKKKR